jgi:hypothetical protein
MSGNGACSHGAEEGDRSYVRATLPQDALFIKTAFMTNVGSGYFYVEAEKEVHVRKAIANIRFVNTRKVTLVPIKEMVQAITIQKKKVNIQQSASHILADIKGRSR